MEAYVITNFFGVFPVNALKTFMKCDWSAKPFA